jgi:hypothetical protein
MSVYIQRFANLNGVTDTQTTWIQAICEAQGVTSPVNGTWIEALARKLGATGTINGTWGEALVKTMGLPFKGTWAQSLADSGLIFIQEATDYQTRVEAASGIVEGYVCLTNKLRFLKYN